MKIQFLNRERINDILANRYDYPLTIVEAPMGYGKTTAVRNFLEIAAIKPIWITFQHERGFIDYYWNKFSDEVSKYNHVSGETLKHLGFPVDVPQMDQVVSVLSDMVNDDKIVLVLDDYHLTNSEPLNRLVELIVSERIENFHLILITRNTIHLNSAELVAKGFCQLITQDLLKFTEAEVRDYCLLMIETISDKDLKKISDYAGGWITLTYMLLLGLEKGIPVGMNMTIDELINQTLFSVYDDAIQNFLIELSIMDTFTEDQAQFITGEEKASLILSQIKKENSFIYFDELNKTYQIHYVLLDFLRTKQRFSLAERRILYSRLGEWYLAKMAFPKAYAYFKQARDNERVLQHLNNPENIRNELAEFDGSAELFAKTPVDVLHQYPLAYLQHILISLLRGNDETMISCCRQLEELEQFFLNQDERVRTDKNRMLAEINIVRKFTFFNHLEESTDRNDLIIALLNGEQSYIMQRENEFTFGSPHLLYNYFRDRGEFETTTKLIIKKFPVYPRYANGNGTGSEYLARAEFALETGKWAEAELNSEKAIYKARTKDQHSIIICATFNLIRLMILQGHINDALNRFRELEKEITEVSNPVYNTTIDICKGYLYANLDQVEKIPFWLQVGDMTTADLFYQGVAFNYLVYGKAVTASRNFVKLEVLAESFVEYFSLYHNQLGFIHNGIFDAIAKYHLYGMAAGVNALEMALAEARPDGIVMPFVENAVHLIAMLKNILARQPEDVFVQKLLSFSKIYVQSLENGELFRVSLTQREHEVLLLTSKGLKREEIANRLYIAPGTVKTHLQNVYRKLEVNGKSAAIKTAVKNGLLISER
nr:LuxR C-terminal-related transcriptional regulator [uncultured Acetobacterium sp.]